MFAGTLWVIGHLTWSLKLLEEFVSGALARGVIRFLYLFLPNFEHFNVRGQLVHGITVAPDQVAFAVIYGLAYTSLVLLAASGVFQRRDFL